MMNNKYVISLGLLFLILIAGCSNRISTDSDYQASTDFSQLKTYRWRDAANTTTRQANDIVDERIRTNVEKELSRKGYRHVTQGEVDFLVNYGVTTQEKTDVRSYNTYSGMAPGFSMGYRRGYYRHGYSMAYSSAPEVRTYHYEEGTFVLDLIDSSTDELVWRGSAEGRLKKNLDLEEKQQAAVTIIAKVLEPFPPENAAHK